MRLVHNRNKPSQLNIVFLPYACLSIRHFAHSFGIVSVVDTKTSVRPAQTRFTETTLRGRM